MNRVEHKPKLFMIILKVVVLILCVQIMITNAKAETFYVAPNGVDQTNAGTQAQPWATISFAIDQVNDGATIEVAPGTYNGEFDLTNNLAVPLRLDRPCPIKLAYVIVVAQH